MEAQVQKGPPDILKLVFREIADERPGADADDVFVTRDPELAMSSGEAADIRSKASGSTSTVSRSVARLVGEAQHHGSEVQCQGTHGVSR